MGNSPAAAAPVSSPPSQMPVRCSCGGEHWGQCNSRDLRPQAQGRVLITEGPICTRSPKEGESLNLWVGAIGELGQRLPECCSRTEKNWDRTPELAATKKDQQNWLGQFEASRLVSFFFFKVIIYFYYLLFFSLF